MLPLGMSETVARFSLPRIRKEDPLPHHPELLAALEGSDLLSVSAPDGIPIMVRVFGTAGGLTPVILLHGLQSHSGWFVQSARFVSDIGHPVYAADRRGSGLSPARRGHVQNLDQLIGDILALRDFVAMRHNTNDVHILGHCFGAVPALAYACRHPGGLQSLILTTPGLYTHADLTVSQKVRVFWECLRGRSGYIPVPLSAGDLTELRSYRDFIEEDPLALRSATARFWLTVFQARRTILRMRGNLTIPVFMGVAPHDPVSDTGANLRFLSRLPSRYKWSIRYDRSLHILEFGEDREAFFQDLKRWLERVSR